MILGIDIGGTKIRTILWSGKKIIAAYEAKTPKTKQEFIKILKTAIKESIGDNKRINSVGIGAAGVIGKNKIIFSPNIRYLKNFDFRGAIPGFLVKIDNDARAFLRGELELGKFAKNKKVLAFTIGTGVGRAFAKNGKVKKIKKFEYPEKWEREYQQIRDFSAEGGSASGGKNDTALVEFFSSQLAIIVKKYSPEIVIIGGGILKRKNFFRRLKKELDEKTKERGLKIIFKKSASADSAAIGAALLIK